MDVPIGSSDLLGVGGDGAEIFETRSGIWGERNVNPAFCGAFGRRRVCGAEDKTHRFSVYDIR